MQPMQMNSNKKIWQIILGGTIGNLSEWYNFLLYGYLATVISDEFFPAKSPLVSITLTFTVFAISFLARPVGGIIFGWIGDTYGRQRSLFISLFMMLIPTVLIGCLPTYKTIGIASPILLCVFRVFQGLSAGGQHTGSAVYIAEHAPPRRRTLWVTTIPTSAALGVLFSSALSFIIVSIFTPEQLVAWGWRVGYLIGTILCIISIVLRIGLPETPDFEQTHESKAHPKPVLSFFSDPAMLKKLLLTLILSGSWGVFYQILFIWMPTYLNRFQHWNNDVTLRINSIYLFIFAFLILAGGYLADRINRNILLVISSMAMLILAHPLFNMLSSGDIHKIQIAMFIFTIIFGLFLPVAFISMLEMFDTQCRYTGFSLGFNTGLAIFGGTCPLVSTWLIEVTGNVTAPAFYLMIAAASSLVISFMIVDKRKYVITCQLHKTLLRMLPSMRRREIYDNPPNS